MDCSKLILRAIEPDDVDFMFKAENDFDAWRYSDYMAPLSKELLQQYAFTYDADPFRAGQLRLIIEIDGTPVGIADIFDISVRHLHAETGIYVLPEYRRKGYAAGALLKLANYCRVRLGLHSLVATVSKLNVAATRCYEKAGFKKTGMFPDWIRLNQEYEDACIFSLILDPIS